MRSQLRRFTECLRATSFAAVALVVSAFQLHAQPWDEYALLRAMPAYALSRNTGGAPNAGGLVGSNQSNSPFFIPDDQRGAMDSMVAGIALRGRGQIADSLCDTYVANGMLAIQTVYSLQTPVGDFSLRNDTITNPGGGAEAYHFFLAWSNRALWLLGQHPHYASLYASQLAALRPKVEKAMDHMVLNGDPNFDLPTSSSQLSVDWGSGNRSVINAAAFASGHKLLTGYSSTAKLDSYWGRLRGWLDNIFVKNNRYVIGSPLYRADDGIFLEKPPGSTAGYDTSYQGVANRFFLYILVNYPDAVPQGDVIGERAGRWFERRFLPDPANSQLCLIDTTHSTRSGLGNQEGSDKTHDRNSGLQALLYYAALFNRPEGNVAADRLARLSSVPAAERTNRVPVVFSEAAATAAATTPFSFAVQATNAGFTPDANYALTITGLPAWLSAGPLLINKSNASRVLSGTPPAGTPSGPISLTVTATNSFGAGTSTTLALEVAPVTAATVAPSADAFVRDGSFSTTNYGSDSTLTVKSSATAGTNRRAYLRFATGTLTGVVATARLRLYGNLGTDPATSVAVRCWGVPTNAWTEGGLAWANRPSGASVLSTIDVGRAFQYWEWDVTAFFKAQRAAGVTDISLLLDSVVNSTGGINFRSKETSNATERPELVITYSSGPGFASATLDTDGDGLADLVDYALGGDPLVPELTPISPTALWDGQRLGLAFRRRDDPVIVYRVLASTDLIVWNEVWSSFGLPQENSLIEVWDATTPPPAGPRFLRLSVRRF